MNIQLLRKRKRIEQEGSKLDLAVLDRVIELAEQTVKDYSLKVKQEMDTKLGKNYLEIQDKLEKNCKELENLLENKGETSQKDIEKALQDV